MGDRRGPSSAPLRNSHPRRRQAQQPATDTATYQDTKCLSRLLLSTWAWHPLCPISRSSDVVPVEFGSHNATESEAVEEYKRFFRPFIIEEALASVHKEAEDEIRDKQSMQIRFRSITDIGEGRADVSCVLVNNRKKNVGRKLKEGNLVFLLNVDPCSAKIGFRELCSRCSRKDFAKTAVFAGWIKFCGRVESDGMHLEVQHARSPNTDRGRASSDPHPGDLLSSSLMTALDDGGHKEPSKWWLISCSSPVTSQREMAALEAMSRRDDVHMLVRPSLTLQGQGGVAHRVWPEQLGFKPYIDYIKQCHDITQLEAVEACSALCASPQQVGKFLSKTRPTDNPSLLPIILIQGPPGTGKTHTVKTVLNSWHLCQFQRFNDAQYQRLCTLLQERKAAAANISKQGGTVPCSTIGGYKRPCNGTASDGAASQAPSAILAANKLEVSAAATSAADAEKLATSVAVGTEKVAVVPRPRILVCAPSNAATDELLKRVLDSRFVDVHGRPYSPRVVRIGSESAAMSDSARKVWVDKIVANLLDYSTTETAKQKILHTESQQRSSMEQRTLAIQRLTFEGISADDRKQTVSDYIAAENKLAQLSNEHDLWTTVHAYLNQATSRWDAEEMLAAAHMSSAEIVFTTLSSTGRRAFERGARFDLVLIDEAAQASEAATLQPLTLGSGKLVLVGDPRQLPATILSKQNQRLAFDRSLFQRLMDAGWPVRMLSVQYRMHPHIRRFPGKHFYDDELKDGHSVTARPMMQFYAHDLFKPYVVYDVSLGRDRTGAAGSGSRWNLGEVNMALALFQELRQYLVALMQKAAKEGTPRPQPCTVGIITPYREQCRRMKQAFEEVLGESVAKEVKIDTVDSFQGKQMDVIIMSCVRASGGDHSSSSNARALLGFVEDVRRMNVGITRARHALWLLGNAKTLSVNEHWRALFEDARTYIKGGCVIEDADAEQLFPDAKLWDPSKTPPKHAEDSGREASGRECSRNSAEPTGPSNGASNSTHAANGSNSASTQQMPVPQGKRLQFPVAVSGGSSITGFSGAAATSVQQNPGNMFQSGGMQPPMQGGTAHIGGMHVPPEKHAQMAADMHGLTDSPESFRPSSMSQVPPQGPQSILQQHQNKVLHNKLEMKLPQTASQRKGAGPAVFSGAGRPLGGVFGAPAPSQFTSSSAVATGGEKDGAEAGRSAKEGVTANKALARDPRRRGGTEEPAAKDPRTRVPRNRSAPLSVGVAGSRLSPSPAKDSEQEPSGAGATSAAAASAASLQKQGPIDGVPQTRKSPPVTATAPGARTTDASTAAAAASAAAAAAVRLKVETKTVKADDEMEDDIVSARGTGTSKAGGDSMHGGQQPCSTVTTHSAAPKASAVDAGGSGVMKGSGVPPWPGVRAPPPYRTPLQPAPWAAAQEWRPVPPPAKRPAVGAGVASGAAAPPAPPTARPHTKYAAPPDVAMQHAQRASSTPPGTPRSSGGSMPPPDLLQNSANPQHTEGGFGGAHAPPDLVMQNSWGSRVAPHSTAGGPATSMPARVEQRRPNNAPAQMHMHVPHAPAHLPVPQTQTQPSSAADFGDIADLKRSRTAAADNHVLQPAWPGAACSMHAGHGRGTLSHSGESSKPPPWVSAVPGAAGSRHGSGRGMHAQHASAHTYKHALPPDVQTTHAVGGGYGMATGAQDADEDIAARRKMHKPQPPPRGHTPYPPPMWPKQHPPPGGLGMPPPPDLLHLK